MSNIYKNYQINLGIPFPVRTPMNLHNIKVVEAEEQNTEEEQEPRETAEEVLAKAREEAEMILLEANYESARILEKAKQDAEEEKTVLFEEARQQGYDEGYNQARQQYEDLVQEAESIKEHARIEYKEVMEGIESDAVNLILDIAKNVIGTEISFHKDDILFLVKEAFDKCGNKESVILKTAPEDYDYLVANKEKLMSMVEGIGELKIVKDNSLKVGACLVETPYGSIDAGVQIKLRKIGEAFREVIGK